MIILLMLVLPIASVVVEIVLYKSPAATMLLIGKWFVFWAMGVRLFTAGLRQAIRPRFTAEAILGIQGTEQFILVQELGFANLSMGALGMVTLLNGNWVFPAALVGCLFIGLAGIRHLFSKSRNLLENSAMLSNLAIAGLLCVYILWALITLI